MLTYLMLQIGLTKINFCHVSFALIFNGLKINFSDAQLLDQESSVGFETLAHLQSIQNKGDIYG